MARRSGQVGWVERPRRRSAERCKSAVLVSNSQMSTRSPTSAVHLGATMRHPILLVAIVVFTSGPLRSETRQGPTGGGRVNQLKVLSDKIDDVTTVENLVKSFTQPGMSDQERAKGLWTAIVKYRHQTAPP